MIIFTLVVSVLTGILFGTLPAVGIRVNLVSALKQSSNQAGERTGRWRMQSALIVAQVAVSVVLLVGAALLLTSFLRLQQVDAGYRSDGVLSAQVYGNFSRYGNINALRRLYMPILERLEGQPGVVTAAITNAVPLAGSVPGTTRFGIEGRVADDPNQPVEDVRTLDDLRAEALAAPRLTATLLAIFAGLALLMTLAGIGGVIATSVTARTREFGVRMALGAAPETVLAMVVWQGLRLVTIGLAIGLAGAGRPVDCAAYRVARCLEP